MKDADLAWAPENTVPLTIVGERGSARRLGSVLEAFAGTDPYTRDEPLLALPIRPARLGPIQLCAPGACAPARWNIWRKPPQNCTLEGSVWAG